MAATLADDDGWHALKCWTISILLSTQLPFQLAEDGSYSPSSPSVVATTASGSIGQDQINLFYQIQYFCVMNLQATPVHKSVMSHIMNNVEAIVTQLVFMINAILVCRMMVNGTIFCKTLNRINDVAFISLLLDTLQEKDAHCILVRGSYSPLQKLLKSKFGIVVGVD